MSGQCWSVPSVWNIYSLGWSPHLWVRALGLSPVSTGCIAQTQTPSCETCRLTWFLCDYTCNKAGRITFILLFWGIWGLFSKVCILVPLMPVLLVPWCFGNSLSPWDLVWFEYKPMGTCQFFIHKLGKLKLNKGVNKPGKSIWSQWSCADLFQPETLSRLERFWGFPMISPLPEFHQNPVAHLCPDPFHLTLHRLREFSWHWDFYMEIFQKLSLLKAIWGYCVGETCLYFHIFLFK